MEKLREIWLKFKEQHGCSIDRMLCNPVLRDAFLREVHQVSGIDDESTVLWGLVSLRKRKALSGQ